MVEIRLSTARTRRFGLRTSGIGYALILLGVAAVVCFTVFAKGKSLDCSYTTYFARKVNDTDSLSRFDDGECLAANIDAGQTLANVYSTFSWTAVTWATYTKPAGLTNCALVNGSSMTVSATIRSNPTIEWNMTYVCIPHTDASRINVWEGIDLYEDSMVLSIQTLSDTTTQGLKNSIAIKSRAIELRNGSRDCNNKDPVGFRIVAPSSNISILADTADGIGCEFEPTDPLYSKIQELFADIGASALDDLDKGLPLTSSVLFSCIECKRKWVDGWSLAWIIVVGIGGGWSLIRLFVWFILRRIDPETILELENGVMLPNTPLPTSTQFREDEKMERPQ
ncbi:hypothetical protein CPB83DRAFT_843041 [Crepidotus variabilis]|uniref:Uncharacterized protein n=1 Tax=Crepidotus variabilis TaxID=179855 RepID=A0A9P6ERN4_9AGAR|nr:hypothetical protein CPB83DRAFT_843041 [Crepidotus variabilis]